MEDHGSRRPLTPSAGTSRKRQKPTPLGVKLGPFLKNSWFRRGGRTLHGTRRCTTNRIPPVSPTNPHPCPLLVCSDIVTVVCTCSLLHTTYVNTANCEATETTCRERSSNTSFRTAMSLRPPPQLRAPPAGQSVPYSSPRKRPVCGGTVEVTLKLCSTKKNVYFVENPLRLLSSVLHVRQTRNKPIWLYFSICGDKKGPHMLVQRPQNTASMHIHTSIQQGVKC